MMRTVMLKHDDAAGVDSDDDKAGGVDETVDDVVDDGGDIRINRTNCNSSSCLINTTSLIISSINTSITIRS